MAQSAAARRYVKRFVPTMIAYCAILAGVTWYIDAARPAGAVLAGLSILPALPIIGVLIVMGLYLAEETDEYVRQRLVTCMIFAMGVVLALSTVLGFLQIHRVIGQVNVFWAFPGWCFAWGMAQTALAVRDRMQGSAE
ncbi:hypothetical protein P1X14_13590 [Sphingomonas sp. AOB5]|uniref:hypothetical protein n=1 Tax=Sphingomonas sp. AOB5 TaxID=3034017 RepID=UPI0023F71483|nr:hypothetical protein [Sphingomonas sp. AOB5]MDF7776284.1 hypothetical protein [Sphingomonas sp. AOB5]